MLLFSLSVSLASALVAHLYTLMDSHGQLFLILDKLANVSIKQAYVTTFYYLFIYLGCYFSCLQHSFKYLLNCVVLDKGIYEAFYGKYTFIFIYPELCIKSNMSNRPNVFYKPAKVHVYGVGIAVGFYHYNVSTLCYIECQYYRGMLISYGR